MSTPLADIDNNIEETKDTSRNFKRDDIPASDSPKSNAKTLHVFKNNKTGDVRLSYSVAENEEDPMTWPWIIVIIFIILFVIILLLAVWFFISLQRLDTSGSISLKKALIDPLLPSQKPSSILLDV